MEQTRPWWMRTALIAALTLFLVISAEREAHAGKYSVVQCGWGVGKDADWAENAAGRYNHSALCVPAGGDVWSGVEIRTYTRPGAGTAPAATAGLWRWTAPPQTKISAVRGTWWHELRNYFQHRLGGRLPNGDFHVTHSASVTHGMEAFSAGFGNTGANTFESRLICARLEPQKCDTSPSSAAMVRALTFTLEENFVPLVGAAGSALSGGWLVGGVEMSYAADDAGGGMRFAETLLDGGQRVGYNDLACDLTVVGGALHGRRMQPCPVKATGGHWIDTRGYSDGPHTLQTCVTDIAGNRGCTAVYNVRIDNNAPAAPIDLRVVGGSDWRASNGFDLVWENPGQGAASPIAGAFFRVTGPGGFDTGFQHRGGGEIASLPGLVLPGAGEYRVAVRLQDQAGHSAESNSSNATLRFDDAAPEVAFRGFADAGLPEQIRARIYDAHSGPGGGSILFRRRGAGDWTELPATLEATGHPGEADLVARVPSDSLEPDVYEFRVIGSDRVGNRAESDRRLDGSLMLMEGPLKKETVLDARLEVDGQTGSNVRAAFASRPQVSGRLTEAAGRPLAGRELRVTILPEAGSRTPPSRLLVTTDEGGEYRFPLEPSTSRRVEVRFPGDARLSASRAPDLGLRVAGSVSMRANRLRVANGGLVRFVGEVETRDAAVPNGGKLVAIQYLDRRARIWRPVMLVRSDAGGRFAARYRFRFITRRSIVRLRALALPEAGWPYELGASTPFNLRVVPRRVSAARSGAPRSGSRRPIRGSGRGRAAPAADRGRWRRGG